MLIHSKTQWKSCWICLFFQDIINIILSWWFNCHIHFIVTDNVSINNAEHRSPFQYFYAFGSSSYTKKTFFKMFLFIFPKCYFVFIFFLPMWTYSYIGQCHSANVSINNAEHRFSFQYFYTVGSSSYTKNLFSKCFFIFPKCYFAFFSFLPQWTYSYIGQCHSDYQTTFLNTYIMATPIAEL